ncbi:hypothetical protein BATDEDRAFT_86492 [Batrachochytrium dendrobatidis JAM81]|uniref:Uncharacterized protein n=1 Tax=Batrachochytrium dendrobatidis (strain JAM81 / FGSC 10211) TaxID=684364 RepID=F4NXJ0_BATDJ|nr:uncharacterized protein BATDEDRAFT_86492 [Batrachochytrium dendrobatidis JAM81]EGF82693.1 hypothetical protein BATDEDRAFT_86492 [Batrachochytrium dendrobatidis JAM81]KAJ8328342.1 hypothetical protein O5D80_003700 [Batrachochytrium dendrobatidis]KAK5673402.1 hypothetical protein QVD99_000851 [Batrachochytrium dendrobatidis]|eukprot:XP_006677019.1 hypothetical protein BATDEDRAFT_86492 [Batrachochytrium dendrobatidis JAM81]
MALYKGITKLPLEVYPIAFMVSCALGFGSYIAFKKIAYDGDMRFRPNQGIKDWTERLETLKKSSN